jgi:hypothetical protein
VAVTDVLRPISTRKVGGGVVVPSGTLHGVTSDNSDLTYIAFNVSSTGDYWSLRVGSHTPPANHQRHRVRGRMRWRSDAGTVNEDIDLGRGTADWILYDTGKAVTAVFAESVGSWFQDPGYGLATAGALADLNVGSGWAAAAAGGATQVRTAEVYVDVDCRARPDYAPEVRDAAGVDQSGGTVTDTNQPTLYFGGVGYDGLPALSWEVEVGAFSTSGVGTPPTEVPVTIGLINGPYTATFTVRSTIRGADPFEHVQEIDFTVDNEVPPPSPPLIEIEEENGGYRINWSNPGGQGWDDDYVVAELWRDDCNGSQRIATIPDGLNGTYLDLAIPQLDPQPVNVEGVCEVHAGECVITYRVRYWGYVSTFVELPDTIPADMILAWPSTAGSIPAGWTRVTALDGRYPRGATGTGAPVATGGASTHFHTTPGHRHTIAAHSHTLGGATGSNGTSTTSARFNGASKDQANQPHTHNRPSATGTAVAVLSGSTAPQADAENNIPPTRDVIWIESDGSQPTYPVGVLGYSTEAVSGWVDDDNSSGRFLRGAAAAGNGGANSGASTHLHSIAAHTHTGSSHTHTLAATGLSNPVGTDAGTGSSTPRWLPRHTHPMTVVSASQGGLNSTAGGNTSASNLEPANRRLRVIRNTGGGTQTRVIGLYLGDVASLDPLMTLCDGNGGTPDMRGWFARDNGSDSINSTGGSDTHNHTTATHDHGVPGHVHDTTVGTSGTGSFEAPTSGDLGDSPTTTHTHSSGNTASSSPGGSPLSSGTTNGLTNHVPPYREAHFVRLDGIISGGPLPVPELRVSDFASSTVGAFTYDDGLDRLATFDRKMAVVTDRTHAFPRLVTDSMPLDGGLHTVSTTLAGEDVNLVIGVQGKPAIDELEELLRAERVYYSPVGGTAGWFAPAGWSVVAPAPEIKVLSVTMVRQDWPPTDPPEAFL